MSKHERICAWLIKADKESENEGGLPTTTVSLPAYSNEEALALVGAVLKSGATKITITDEDRYIRDMRRANKCHPDVEIEGYPGARRVKW